MLEEKLKIRHRQMACGVCAIIPRISAFTEFAGDVKTGAYPEAGHEVGITQEEMKSFKKMLSSSKS